jgi:hypothetical protein
VATYSNFNQPLGNQDADRFANGCAAEAVIGHEVGFGRQVGTRLQARYQD